MSRTYKSLWATFVAIILVSFDYAAAEGVFNAGRMADPKRDASFRVTAGSVMEIRGMVQETTRSYYDVTDQEFKQDLAEDYDLDDFNVDDGHPTVGISMEKIWKYFTLQFDLFVMNPEADAIAKRNYYIGVGDEIQYEGGSYDNMKIPSGSSFSWEIFGGMLELRGLITPFTVRFSDESSFTPWLELGLFGFLGQYEIDNGPARGVTQYQNPPKDFVIGGSSKGILGAGVPQLGLGGEFRFGSPDRFNLVLEGSYAFLDFEGSTRYFTTSDHREKDLDLEHDNMRVRCVGEIPLKSGHALLLGAQYQVVDSEAMITSQEASEEEIIARRERFDKHADFSVTTAGVLIGITF